MYIILLSVCIFILDRLSKLWIVDHMALYESIDIVPHVMSITYILNRGAAFGILENQISFFIAVVALLTVAVAFFWKRIQNFSKLGQTAVALVIGGAMGNVYDRITQSAVVDFINFHFWPIFNIADIAITLGVIILMIIILKEEQK